MDHQATKIIEFARDVLKAHGYFVDNLWHVTDIHFICEQHGMERLSDEDAMEVFCIANEQFDGEIGLSWPQLERAVKCFFKRRAILSGMEEDEAQA